VVEVDPETAGVTIERYVVCHDAGRIVSPVLAEGQVVGGVIQGLGGALLEEFVHDTSGQPLSTSLMDYLIPTGRGKPRRGAAAHRLAEPDPSTRDQGTGRGRHSGRTGGDR